MDVVQLRRASLLGGCRVLLAVLCHRDQHLADADSIRLDFDIGRTLRDVAVCDKHLKQLLLVRIVGIVDSRAVAYLVSKSTHQPVVKAVFGRPDRRPMIVRPEVAERRRWSIRSPGSVPRASREAE